MSIKLTEMGLFQILYINRSSILNFFLFFLKNKNGKKLKMNILRNKLVIITFYRNKIRMFTVKINFF